MRPLLIIQQWLPFTVGAHDLAFTSEGELFAEDTWNADQEGEEGKDACNDEGEDPLEGKDLGSHLGDGECWTASVFTSMLEKRGSK
jgi:hypothetical protein